MEKVVNIDGDTVTVVTIEDHLAASNKLWGWVITVGIGILISTTVWAVKLDAKTDNLSTYGTAQSRRLEKSVDSLIIVVGVYTEEVRRLTLRVGP
jgi:hypothetical protein